MDSLTISFVNLNLQKVVKLVAVNYNTASQDKNFSICLSRSMHIQELIFFSPCTL